MPRRKKLKSPMSREEAKKQLEELDLEKGDIPAMVIAGFLTFGPILITLVCIVLFLAWFFTRGG